jgi:hypothetical protein
MKTWTTIQRRFSTVRWSFSREFPNPIDGRSALWPISSVSATQVWQRVPLGHAGALDRLENSSHHSKANLSHRLRHGFATEMVRLGVSLPVLMQLLGHKDIRMTLRYVEVAQVDLQREFHRARQNTAPLYSIPQLPLPTATPQKADLAALRQAVAAARHLFQLFQSQLEDKPRRKLHRLSQRLLKISRELDYFSQK